MPVDPPLPLLFYFRYISVCFFLLGGGGTLLIPPPQGMNSSQSKAIFISTPQLCFGLIISNAPPPPPQLCLLDRHSAPPSILGPLCVPPLSMEPLVVVPPHFWDPLCCRPPTCKVPHCVRPPHFAYRPPIPVQLLAIEPYATPPPFVPMEL